MFHTGAAGVSLSSRIAPLKEMVRLTLLIVLEIQDSQRPVTDNYNIIYMNNYT